MKKSQMITRSYSELVTIPTFKERYEYLKLNGRVGEETFGFDRYLNQRFYKSSEWRRLRNEIILRDSGCDLGMEDREIQGTIIIHHMNPVSVEDLMYHIGHVMNPDFLICTSLTTHNAIHYGDESLLLRDDVVERKPYDTCPWRQ